MRAQVVSAGDRAQYLVQILDPDARALDLDQIVDLVPWEPARTLDQNAFYHRFVAFALPFYQATDPALNHDNLHAYFRDRILGFSQVVCGEVIRIQPTTTKLSKRQFSRFFEATMQRAAEEAQAPVGAFMAEYEAWKQGWVK